MNDMFYISKVEDDNNITLSNSFGDRIVSKEELSKMNNFIAGYNKVADTVRVSSRYELAKCYTARQNLMGKRVSNLTVDAVDNIVDFRVMSYNIIDDNNLEVIVSTDVPTLDFLTRIYFDYQKLFEQIRLLKKFLHKDTVNVHFIFDFLGSDAAIAMNWYAIGSDDEVTANVIATILNINASAVYNTTTLIQSLPVFNIASIKFTDRTDLSRVTAFIKTFNFIKTFGFLEKGMDTDNYDKEYIQIDKELSIDFRNHSLNPNVELTYAFGLNKIKILEKDKEIFKGYSDILEVY